MDKECYKIINNDDINFTKINVDHKITDDNFLSYIVDKNLLYVGAYSSVYNINDDHVIKFCNTSKYKFLDMTTELFILTNLNHVNVLKCNLVFQKNNSIMFILPKFSRNLDEIIPKSVEEKESVMSQIVTGVQYLHSKNILHLDLVPRNIIVNVNNGIFHVVICDFSLSCFNLNNEYISKTSRISCDHRPYENLCGSQIYRPKSDVWSLGVIFYRIISNKRLFAFSVVPRGERLNFHFENSTRFEIEKRYYWKQWPPICDSRISQMLELDIEKRIDSTSLCHLFNVNPIIKSKIKNNVKTLNSKWEYVDKIFKQNNLNITYQVERLFKMSLEKLGSVISTENKENKLFLACFVIVNSVQIDIKFFVNKENIQYFDDVFKIFCVSNGEIIEYD